MSVMRFIKMQGAGNDYVYVDCFTEPIDLQRLRHVLEKYRKPTNHQTVLIVEDDP